MWRLKSQVKIWFTRDPHPASLLDVLEPGHDLPLNEEVDPDPELDALLDHELLQRK